MIQDYISKSEVALAKFESLVNQIQKNAKDIDVRVERIKEAQLFKRPHAKIDGSLPTVKVKVFCYSLNKISLQV